MESPHSASVSDVQQESEENNDFRLGQRTKSSSVLTTCSLSSTPPVEEVETYALPRDSRRQTRRRTLSFSPGSVQSKYDLLRTKYELTKRSFRAKNPTSLSASSSDSSVSSSTQARSSQESPKQFWNQYRRQNIKSPSLTNLLRRALSMRSTNIKTKTTKVVFKYDSFKEETDNSNDDGGEEVYYEKMYQEIYVQRSQSDRKKPCRRCRKSKTSSQSNIIL